MLKTLLCATLVAGVHAFADMTPPDVLVKTVTTEVMAIVSKDEDIKAGNKSKIIGLVEQKVLPHFNFASMTALAMGRNWSRSSPEQKKQLSDQFRTLLVRTYASALTSYRDQRFEYRPLRAKPTDTDVTVQVRVMQSGAQPVSIQYAMEKTASGWKAYDLVVGGVSLVQNYRTDFSNQVRDVGVDGLIKNLESKNRALDQTATAPDKK